MNFIWLYEPNRWLVIDFSFLFYCFMIVFC
nr:MAG TPA: hypothetical protein [Caudoviricetes sp.]